MSPAAKVSRASSHHHDGDSALSLDRNGRFSWRSLEPPAPAQPSHNHDDETTTTAVTTTAPPVTQDPTTEAPTTVAPPVTDPPTTATTTPPTSAAPGGQLIFDDEFNGTSLNTSVWQPNWLSSNNTDITKPVNSEEVSCYDPSQVSEPGDGYLHLDAVKRSCTANNGQTYQYASGLVNTYHSFTFTYGHMEARMWLQPGSGGAADWPAFWAAGTGVWPITGELDVMEGLGGPDCFHFHSPLGGPGTCANLADASGWHTFGADWSPGQVTYTYDGNVVGTITTGITSAPMYLILNLWINGNHPITAPATTLVDYVRVWKN